MSLLSLARNNSTHSIFHMSKDNQYIPKYIKDSPWYHVDSTNTTDDPLAHHRSKDANAAINGAPRAGDGIKDVFIETYHDRKKSRNTLELNDNPVSTRKEDGDYDEKRDRWYGYDSKDYLDNISLINQKSKEQANESETAEYKLDSDEELELRELGLWELYSSDKSIFLKDISKTVRLREDKAVYLRNIFNNEKITYDPKSRTDRSDSVGYFNDKNLFVRHLTGDAKKYQQSKVFAWDDGQRDTKVTDDNLTSNPTLSEIRNRDQKPKDSLKKGLISRYHSVEDGDDSKHIEEETGSTIVNRSFSYQEDVFIGNHTSVWGSYYHDGKWGFKCCKKFEKDSLCS